MFRQMTLRRRRDSKADAFRRVPLFQNLTRHERELLAKMAEELDFRAGTVLCREGRNAREFFVILEGEACATKGGETVRTLGPGEFFGELALIEHLPRALTLTATTPVRAFVLSSQCFSSVIANNPDLERKVLRTLVLENVTVRTIAERALRNQAELNEHQALHDALTGLPNRRLFRQRIAQALDDLGGLKTAVLILDLDRFKEVNDTLGHEAGDKLLQELGGRLRNAVRSSDTVARLGGDEFGVLLPRQANVEDVVLTIERIRQAIEEPVIVQGLPLGVEASIGVAFAPDDAVDVESLLRRADVAMYRAKEENATYAFHDEAIDRRDPARLLLVGELRRAIRNRELVLYYQPKAALRSGEVASVEALVRWDHPKSGLIPPDEFVPLAERTGLMKPFTSYAIDEALRQCAEWRERGLDLTVAVNLSMRNLLDVSFPEEVAELLRVRGVEPARLEFEITESTVLVDPTRSKLVLDRLSAMGVKLSIDDFGTGYSSLAYLKRLPLNELKIDRSFVMHMLENEDDAVIVRSTIDLARNLGLEVVAEGVEDAPTWDALASLGCDVAQGYFLSRPVPAEELGAWLAGRARGSVAEFKRPAA
jgi:diguanylate cyclase (GGDEF)-like protein